jgi:hypothetical protein
MRWLVGLGLVVLVQVHEPGSTSIDVSALSVGAPKPVAELDLGKLKGEPRQLAWSADAAQFYLQTMERKGKQEIPHHYVVATTNGSVTPADAEPAWATEYWSFKSDRYAPGLPSLVIDVKQSVENMKYGTGSAGAADPSSGGLVGENQFGGSANNVAKASQSQHLDVTSLVLLDETIGKWANQKPTPGTTFSWGPSGSGAIAFADEDGRLVLLDSQKRKQRIAGTKETCLPAWSEDGSRLAWLAKSGRNKYTLSWAVVTRR